MKSRSFLLTVALLGMLQCALLGLADGTDSDVERDSGKVSQLPVFFFHGVTTSALSGYNIQQNLTAEGRVFVGLNFCPDLCSVSALNAQVQTAISVIRETVASDSRFAHGYIFIGHSQGAVIARAVVEEMDGHKVRKLISLAGPHNGMFYGPQSSDMIPWLVYATALGPLMIPSTLFDFAKYGLADYASGRFVYDFNAFANAHPDLQDTLSSLNLARSPVTHEWLATNPFLPVINNLISCCALSSNRSEKRQCKTDKWRRRFNFLLLKEAHFFGSPADDVISPWQSTILGVYNTVKTAEELRDQFTRLHVLSMKDTDEFQDDTYGLRTLEKRGGLFLHEVPNVGHKCWVVDAVPVGKTDMCRFQPVYDHYIYPLLH